ncbi:hypothetical protein FH972_001028 [Carpinus fangiana]|uniref:Uncharacterized protein n=1 Tax=Carpinus fangiana TaxID=176857 RepID=A0A5N6QAP9_9ROSI|nr:hypothetical protein FH972_001028 [Carpinus fangiana]
MEGDAQKFFDKSLQKMLEFHANILAFEQKMHIMMRECKKGFKKDGDRPGQRSLMDWIKVREISNDESGVLVAMKVQAVEAAIKLSHLLIDFVFMMSRQDELAEKIWEFKSALKWVTEDGNFNSLVIDKVLILLEMAEEEVSEMKRSRELKNKGKAKLIDQGERSSGRIRVHELVDQCFEQTLYQIFDLFLEVVLRLESIVSHRNLPADSDMLIKEALSMVESGLRQCEEVLEWIRGDIITLKKMFPLKLELKKDAKTTETRILVACRIDDLWSEALDNSSEEKDEDDSFNHTFRAKFERQNGMYTTSENDEIDFPGTSSEDDDEAGDVEIRSGVTRAEIEQVQSSLNNEGVDLPEPASEMEVEAEEPSKKCCCCCCCK